MSSPADQRSPEQRSPLVRFFDAFFQERNIKWMLGLGILILLGSSLMLVTSHWDTYTPVWKYVVMLGYTAAIHGLGQVCYHSLSLRKTGTGLMVLTVGLLPLTFLGVRWVHPAGMLTWAGLTGQAGILALLGVNLVFTTLAARRIFRHFLRRTQPTFLVSFVVLAASGAVVPILPTSLATVTALVLWCVFAVGAIKVNRHVFWLTEEHRLPRVYGFFPILLLGGMFLTLFATSLAPHVPLQWLGPGLVLTAIPVLLTADALVRVLAAREDHLPGPVPWSVGLPVFVGLAFTVAGVCVAGVGFPRTVALPPTAIMAAAVMSGTAVRTKRTGFVWLMLLAVLTAYQTSPVFFRELVQWSVHQGASAVRESRLPLAFYGLTYLPLLTALSLAGAWLKRRDLNYFARPIQQFSAALGLLLLLAAPTHAKAMFPVGVALAGLFGLQLVLFRERRWLLAVIAAVLLIGAGTETFFADILRVHTLPETPWLVWALISGLLLFPGALLDRWTLAFTSSATKQKMREWERWPLCQLTSLAIVSLLAGTSLFAIVLAPQVPYVSATLAGVILVAHTWQWRNRGIAISAWAYPVLALSLWALKAEWTIVSLTSVQSMVLVAMWVLGRSAQLPGYVRPGFLTLLRRGAADVAGVGLLLLVLGYTLPLALGILVLGSHHFSWIAGGITLLWLIDAAWRTQSRWLAIVAWCQLLGLTELVAVATWGWGAARPWHPALWASISAASVLLLGRSGTARDGRTSPLPAVHTWRICVMVTLSLIALGSLLVFTTPLRVAGVVSLVGVLLAAVMWRQSGIQVAAWSVASWQVLSGLMQVMTPEIHSVYELHFPLAPLAALPMASAAAMLSLAWNIGHMRPGATGTASHVQSHLLRVVSAILLAGTLPFFGEKLTFIQALLAGGTFGLFAFQQVWFASRELRLLAADANSNIQLDVEWRVWTSLGLIGAGTGYLLLFRAIPLGTSFGLFVPLVVGVVLWAIGRWSESSNRWSFMSRPFLSTGLCLPACTVVLGVLRHVSLSHPTWLGINSLALLLAAAFYFWLGLEKKTPALLIGSATILNIALALLWRELSFSDPQFFLIPLGITLLGMVELLKPQIEPRSLNPLRYVGALTILVSPTFHIVEGSWIHLLTLMVASVAITLVAMGLRIKALMYTGTAFLVADLAAMVVRGSINDPSLLWIAGILLGVSVIGLAAYCERHREQMLQRLRMVVAELETWS